VDSPGPGVALFFLQYVPVFTLTPRFVLSMRKMYARNTYGGRRHGIDTGFGLSPLSSHVGTRSSIVFADDGGEREGSGRESEDIQIETRTP